MRDTHFVCYIFHEIRLPEVKTNEAKFKKLLKIESRCSFIFFCLVGVNFNFLLDWLEFKYTSSIFIDFLSPVIMIYHDAP